MTPHKLLRSTIALPPRAFCFDSSALDPANLAIRRVADGQGINVRRREDWIALVELVSGRGL